MQLLQLPHWQLALQVLLWVPHFPQCLLAVVPAAHWYVTGTLAQELEPVTFRSLQTGPFIT